MPDNFSGHLLAFARALLRVESFRDLLDVTRDELERAVGYKHAWLRISDEADTVTEVRLVEVSSALSDRFREAVPVLKVKDDAIMSEVFQSDVPIVIVDARLDARADQRIVEALGNRTIVNIPLRLVDTPFGIIGTGTFGDEGVRVPTGEQLDYLVAMATQISMAASRIRYREQQATARRDHEELQRHLATVQRLKSLGSMADGVAHDFNNLLTIILGCAQMAQLASNDPAVNLELEGIVNAATRGSALTRQLLVMGRSQPLEVRPIDVNLRLRELVTLLRRVLPENVDIKLIEHTGQMFVEGDASQLDQAFMNLCINARDAMPAGGRLTMEVEQVLVNDAFVDTHPWAKPGRYILTTLTDTGVGMTPEVLERVFEPFFTTKAAQSGTGLGLAVAYGSVRQHDGMMHCYSEPDVGTTFKVYLPLMSRTATHVGSRIDGPVRGGNERILVAEDDTAVRSVIERILGRAGYLLVVAKNGAEAVQAAKNEHFDLVILDVIMPGLSCADTLKQLREQNPDIRVLLSSGYTADTNVSQLMRQANCELLAKPYDPDRLLGTVRGALES